jgi:hypothetical protein
MKRSLLISESEKERILLLYEAPTSLPSPSQFVRDMSKTLGIPEDIMIAIDWSIYKTGGKQPNQQTLNLLSQKFATLKPQINSVVGTLKTDVNKQKSILNYLNGYKTGLLTKEQIQFLTDLKKQLQTSSTTPTQTTPTQTTQQPSQYKLDPNFGKQVQTTTQPIKPTLARYTDL